MNSLVAQTVKSLSAMPEAQVSLDKEDPLEKEIAVHSSILAWEIPWTEKPGRLQSMGSQRVGQDFLSQIWMIALPCRVFLVLGVFLSLLGIYYATPLWPAKFFLKSQLIVLWEFPCTCFFLVAFKTLLIIHFCQFIYNVSRWGPLWVHLVWDSLCFLYLDICFHP